jgi:hypothetical protein
MHVETDEESLLLSRHGLQHGHLRVLNTKVNPILTTNFTHLKAVHTKDSPPIPPRCHPVDPHMM